jgi:hypothetical protein
VVKEKAEREMTSTTTTIRSFFLLLPLCCLLLLPSAAIAFAPVAPAAAVMIARTSRKIEVPSESFAHMPTPRTLSPSSALNAATPDLDVIALVAGQENYGLAVVCLGEAIWSFVEAPSLDHGLKTLGPAIAAAVLLGFVSGPMITSGDLSSVGTGLWIATGVSVGLGAAYVFRLLAPFSPSAKEIAFLGLLVSVAGFFSFSQNLIVDGFLTLPSIDFQLPF